MIPEAQLQEFISDRVVDLFGDTKKEKAIWTKFVLTYYDTYQLLGLTKKNIMFLDEEVMQLVIPHKNKLYFRIVYEPNFRTFELRTIIFGSSFPKCIRVVNHIKQVLAKYNIGSHIDSTTHRDKKTYTNVDIVKIPL